MEASYFGGKTPEPETASRAASISDELLASDTRESRSPIPQRNAQHMQAVLRDIRGDEGKKPQLNTTGPNFGDGGTQPYEVLASIADLGKGDIIVVVGATQTGYRVRRTRDGHECVVKPEPATFREVKDYRSASVGLEQEVVGYKVNLGTNAKAVIGEVRKNGELLVEFTKDMGGDSASVGRGDYTIEFRTTPVEKADVVGLERRRGATAAIVKAIKQVRNGGTVPSQELDGFDIQILNSDHIINGTYDMLFANQASLGVQTKQLFEGAPGDCQTIMTHAHWIRPDYAKQFDSHGSSSAAATNVFVMLASVVNYIVTLVKESDSKATSVSINMVDPRIKDRWAVLPRTPPWQWLDCLHAQEREAVVSQLDKLFAEGLDKAALTYIRTKQALAGHDVPQATIEGQHASVFELRQVPPELDTLPYVDQQPVELTKQEAVEETASQKEEKEDVQNTLRDAILRRRRPHGK